MRALYEPIGRCIYCGTRGSSENRLTKEHILPSGLGGTLVVRLASCEDCNRLTTFFEDRCLHANLNPIRTALGARGKRHKKGRAERDKFPVTHSPEAVSEDIPIEEYPIFLTMPILGRPGFWVGRDHASVLDTWTWVAANAQEKADQVMAARGSDELELTHTLPMPEFVKLLAKIGHSFASAERKEFRPVLTGLIRSARDASVDDATFFIGSAVEPPEGFPLWKPGDGAHRVALMEFRKPLLHVTVHSAIIQLFTLLRSPTYEVIVGFSK